MNRTHCATHGAGVETDGLGRCMATVRRPFMDGAMTCGHLATGPGADAACEALDRNSATYCAYCGQGFPLDAPESAALVSVHIAECERHPMRAVERDLRAARKSYAEALAERDTAHEEAEKLRADLSHERDGAAWLERALDRTITERDTAREEAEKSSDECDYTESVLRERTAEAERLRARVAEMQAQLADVPRQIHAAQEIVHLRYHASGIDTRVAGGGSHDRTRHGQGPRARRAHVDCAASVGRRHHRPADNDRNHRPGPSRRPRGSGTGDC